MIALVIAFAVASVALVVTALAMLVLISSRPPRRTTFRP